MATALSAQAALYVALIVLFPWWVLVALIAGCTAWFVAEVSLAPVLPEQEPTAPVIELNAFSEFDEIRERRRVA